MARPSSRLVEWSQYAALRAFVGTLQCLSPEENLRTATVVGQLYARANPKRLRRAIRNIELSFPEMSRDEVESIARRSIEHMFRLFMVDAIMMPQIITPDRWMHHVRFAQMEEGLAALSRADPAILISGHCGNWELLGFLLSTLGFRVHALARPLDNRLANDWLMGVREARGLRIITKWGATSYVQRLLRRGEKVAFVADQNAGDGGLFVPFFGRLASCYKSMAMLAIRYNATVVAGTAQRLVDHRMQYEVTGNDVIRPDEWQAEADPLFYLTARITRSIEIMVRQSPEQYLWVHRRWKSRPRFEREGRPIPARLVRKLAALPWMTDRELDRIVALANNPPGEAAASVPT